MRACANSFIHSVIHVLMHSFMHAFIHSFIHSGIDIQECVAKLLRCLFCTVLQIGPHLTEVENITVRRNCLTSMLIHEEHCPIGIEPKLDLKIKTSITHNLNISPYSQLIFPSRVPWRWSWPWSQLPYFLNELAGNSCIICKQRSLKKPKRSAIGILTLKINRLLIITTLTSKYDLHC